MVEVRKIEGKTKEEAMPACLEELKVEETELYTRYQETEAKLFKSKKVILEVVTKEDITNYLKEFISEYAKGMNIEIHSEIKENDGIYNVVLVSEDHNPILIGKDGRTLSALQTLLRSSIQAKTGFTIKVVVDVANYKAKKQKNLEFEARKIAREVLKTKVEAKLDPMNSYDRRVVHEVVSKFENLETESFGETPNRYVVIRYKKD